MILTIEFSFLISSVRVALNFMKFKVRKCSRISCSTRADWEQGTGVPLTFWTMMSRFGSSNCAITGDFSGVE